MNHHLKRLASMGEKNSRIILGLMSGTSSDGLDIALCRISGHGLTTKNETIHFETISYPAAWRNRLLNICSKPKVDSLELCQTHNHLAKWQAKEILQFLKKQKMNPQHIDLIASHGHTFFHAPYSLHLDQQFGNATFQIVDGDHLAHETGIITIHDFRQKHIAAGGEGAPLALYGDFLLFAHETKNRILLNVGGISNMSYLPSGRNFSTCFASDIGPGNTLMDKWIQRFNNNFTYDKDGDMASKGIVNTKFLSILKENSFFKLPFPKTTGPETFNEIFLNEAIAKCGVGDELSTEDVMATLNRFTAETILEAIEAWCNKDDAELIVSGGGVFNKTLMKNLKQLFGDKGKILPSNDLGVASDAKEAILFALLANEMVCGSQIFETAEKTKPGINMGKISIPD